MNLYRVETIFFLDKMESLHSYFLSKKVLFRSLLEFCIQSFIITRLQPKSEEETFKKQQMRRILKSLMAK